MLWSDSSNFCRRSQQSAMSYFNLHVVAPHYEVFPLSCYLIPLRPKYPPQHSIPKQPYPWMWATKFHTHTKQHEKFILLFFLIFMCFVSKLEDKRFCTLWQQAFRDLNLLSISTRIKFWFIRVVPKYLKCSTLSRDLTTDFMLWFCPAFWSQDVTMYLVLSAFTSSPFSSLATTISSVIFYSMYTSTQYVNIISMN